jgi:uncharacterized protein YeaO (DUF488 family)
MSEKQSVRRTFQMSEEANDNFKRITRSLGVNQFLFISAMLECIEPSDEIVQRAARKAREATEGVKRMRSQLRQLKPEELDELMKLIGKR